MKSRVNIYFKSNLSVSGWATQSYHALENKRDAGEILSKMRETFIIVSFAFNSCY